jgi:hypothetical protein
VEIVRTLVTLLLLINLHQLLELVIQWNKFYEKREHVTDKFLTYHITILIRDFNGNAPREDIFSPSIGTDSLFETNNDNGVGVLKFATSKS